MLLIVTDRGTGTTRGDYFDESYNHIDNMTWGFPNASIVPGIPDEIDKMRKIAERLSEDIPQVRVDFYTVNGQVYFGELTFFDGSGFDEIVPDNWDVKMGEWLILP